MSGDWQVRPDGIGSVHPLGPDCSKLECRPVVVIDPENREQVQELTDALGLFPGGSLVRRALRSLVTYPPPTPTGPIGPIVHALMYRDHVMGALCNSGAWGTAQIFTAVTENVTCPGCRTKLEGARA